MRYTDLGKALRAMAEDGAIAAAFGINQKRLSLVLAGLCASLAAVAGICLALTFTLTPSQIFAWVGVIFAAVMLGGLAAHWARWPPGSSSASARPSRWRLRPRRGRPSSRFRC